MVRKIRFELIFVTILYRITLYYFPSGDCFNQLNYPRIFCLVSNHLLNKTCKMSTHILTVPSQSNLKYSLCDFITRFLLVGFAAKHRQELNLLAMRIELICTHGIPLYPRIFFYWFLSLLSNYLVPQQATSGKFSVLANPQSHSYCITLSCFSVEDNF